MKKYFFCLYLLSYLTLTGNAQQIDLNKPSQLITKDNLFKFNGGFSASAVTYSGNEPSNRNPFVYYLNGSINANIMGLVDLPFSFNFTNSGSNYTYPTLPNRFAIHPVYKSLTGHFGDVSMNFSPYTLNGHQFTGAGLEYNPKSSPLKVAIMYGRLQKSVEYGDGNNQVQAAYRRMGTGCRLRFEKPKYQVGMTLFSAKDDMNSLKIPVPDSLILLPQSNLAGSVFANVTPLENLQFSVEYGLSLLNRDIRAQSKLSEATFDALKMLLNYTFKSNTVGIGYERVDPNYKSLGAHFFNNDLENITLNYSRPFFQNKATIALSGGVEHDDLNREKESKTSRFVFSADANYAHSEKLNFVFSYTTFQTHMNLKSQFDYINELTPYDNLDTLDYTQLSQNVNLGSSYVLQKNEQQNQQLNLYLSYQEAADKQGEFIQEGALSQFYNASLGYGIQYVPKQLNLNASVNFTSSRMEGQELFILGPTVGVTARFLDKKLSSGLVASYNIGYNAGILQNEVWNLRFNAGYTLLKKHQFSVTAIYRNSQIPSAQVKHLNGLTCTTAYSYRF